MIKSGVVQPQNRHADYQVLSVSVVLATWFAAGEVPLIFHIS